MDRNVGSSSAGAAEGAAPPDHAAARKKYSKKPKCLFSLSLPSLYFSVISFFLFFLVFLPFSVFVLLFVGGVGLGEFNGRICNALDQLFSIFFAGIVSGDIWPWRPGSTGKKCEGLRAPLGSTPEQKVGKEKNKSIFGHILYQFFQCLGRGFGRSDPNMGFLSL